MRKKNLNKEVAAPVQEQVQPTEAKKQSLAGTAFVYNGKTYVLQDGPVNFETKIPQPQISLNPTMSFVSDGKGGAKLQITPHPKAELPVFGAPVKK